MVSFCCWFKSKRRGRRGEKICCGVAQEDEKPEGERRTSAAPEEEEEGEKKAESPGLLSEEEESEADGEEGYKEGDCKKKVEAPVEEKPKGGDGKKAKKEGDGKRENRTKEPPSPPEEIELRVSMHCDGCARKIRCILKSDEGVAEVAADRRARKVVEHPKRETDKKVQLLTPLPTPQPGKKKPKAKDQPKKKKKEEDKKEKIVVASFKLQMHCPACAQKIAKKILKMQGVESAEADWEASKVTVKGVFTAEKLAGYVHQKTTKCVVVVTRDEPAAAPEKVEEETSGGALEQEEDGIDECEDAEDEMIVENGTGEGKEAIKMEATTKVVEEEATMKQRCRPCSTCETRYPGNGCPLCGRGFFDPVPEYPDVGFPRFFSDENPNACCLM